MASLNESLTDIYSPSYFKSIANTQSIKLKPLDFTNINDTTISFESKDDLYMHTSHHLQVVEDLMDDNEKRK